MSYVGESPTVGCAARLKLLVRDQDGRHEACGDEVEAHDQSGEREHFLRVADAARGMLRLIPFVAAHERHQAHAGLET